jgi:hypothetical protein
MGEPLEGKYANYFEIGYTKFEIFVDFGQFDPERQLPLRHTRMVLTPASARKLLGMLGEVMARYEMEVGPAE